VPGVDQVGEHGQQRSVDQCNPEAHNADWDDEHAVAAREGQDEAADALQNQTDGRQ